MYDSKTNYLRVRLRERKQVFEYYRKVNGKPLKLTISEVSAISITEARREAERISGLIAQGIDPREDRRRKAEEEEKARGDRIRASISFADAWEAYTQERAWKWSEKHQRDHKDAMQAPGKKRKRSSKLTVAGPLWPLHDVALSALDTERLEQWLDGELQKNRPSVTARAFRLLRAFFNWLDAHPNYSGIVATDLLSARIKDKIPRVQAKEGDALQKDQLKPWFSAVRKINEPSQRAFLQCLLLLGCRSNELQSLKWEDVDFSWNALTIHDKVEGERTIPLPPYAKQLITGLPRRNQWVFSSPRTDNPISPPARKHDQALKAACLPHITLHGLRRSFGTLAEWIEAPVGVVAQIQGHKPSAIAEKHYRRRPIDLLGKWHNKIEAFILEQAEIAQPDSDSKIMEVVK